MSEAASVSEVIPRPPKLGRIGWSDVGTALRGGLGDLGRAPVYGLVFGLMLAAAGVLAIVSVTWLDAGWLAVCIGVVFPLVFPFLTAGLYEVSRRLETGAPITLGGLWSTVRSRSEIGWMAFVTVFIFIVWMYQVRFLMALFLGLNASFSSLSEFMTVVLTTSEGLMFLGVGNIIGAMLALTLFSLTVISFPLVLDRDVDIVTAMITSIRTVAASPMVMLGWAGVIGVLLLLSALPFFLGLVVTLPVLGHATWHLYRRAIAPDTSVS